MSQRQGAKICGVSLSTFQYHLTESRSGSDRKSVTGSAATKARRSDLPSTMRHKAEDLLGWVKVPEKLSRLR